MGSSPYWREFAQDFIVIFMLKSIALFDIDNTLYEGFSYFELLEKQANEGLISTQVLDDAKTSMKKYKSKLQDYETTIVELLDIYAVGLKGKSYDDVLKSTKEFYQSSQKFFPYAKLIIAELRDSHDVALVTGEPQFVAKAVAELFGLKSYYCTEYEVQIGKFTGNVKSYLASRHEKHDAIKHLMQGYGTKNSFAFGDSEGDIEMLRAVEYPICLNCTDGLRAIAEKEHWHMPNMEEVTELIGDLKAA
jgi:HAD superfamily hydrolase (TIGR01490 family)